MGNIFTSGIQLFSYGDKYMCIQICTCIYSIFEILLKTHLISYFTHLTLYHECFSYHTKSTHKMHSQWIHSISSMDIPKYISHPIITISLFGIIIPKHIRCSIIVGCLDLLFLLLEYFY